MTFCFFYCRTFFYFRYGEHFDLFAKVYEMPLPKLLAKFVRKVMAKGVMYTCDRYFITLHHLFILLILFTFYHLCSVPILVGKVFEYLYIILYIISS